MPKDEFDFEDPLEINGVAFLTGQDTSAEMAECFAEEFMRMGYNHKQVLALFRNPHYAGPNMVLQNKGEPFVRDIIAETFARWGRPIQWPNPGGSRREEIQISKKERHEANERGGDGSSPDPVSPSTSAMGTGRPHPVHWQAQTSPSPADANEDQSLLTSAATREADENFTDPLGNPAPKPNL